MSRKFVVFLVIIAIVIAGIAFGSMVLNRQPAQPLPSNTSCKSEDLAGNFTSAPEVNNTSNGPYNVTFYVQNLGSQAATITQYTDNNGLTQSVNWIVPASTTETFQTTLSKPENSLALETSCNTLFAANYYSTPSSAQTKHYEVNLFVSLGGTAS